MFAKKKEIIFNGILSVCLLTMMVSCHKYRIEDMSKIEAFHDLTSSSHSSMLATSEDGKGGAVVDLYIDYSDCMTTAKESEYYNRVQPAIIACNPNYYSIKADKITFESNDKMKIHQLLNGIKNVDYSNIKGAVDSILIKGHEAMIITDGEYYLKGIGANLNNPYLADEFKEWLQRGLDVYVYSEPYLSGKFSKFRYYILFTDHCIDNNIQQIFERNAPKLDGVKMIHLYSGLPAVEVEEDGVEFNEQLLATNDAVVNPAKLFEYHTLDAEWEDVFNYVKNATDDDGNLIDGGDFFIKGIKLNVTEQDAYKPSELEVVCYEISDLYDSFSPKSKKSVQMPEPMANMFVIDEKAWKKGNIVIKLHPDFDGSSLVGTLGNLIRIDLRVKKSSENFTSNENIGGNFIFESPYGTNTSVYESLKQTLLDPAISPEQSGNTVLYSIYISTYTL